jgi:hypothetical protein
MDSVKMATMPSAPHFAEIIVTFVQDMPYCLVLPRGCDPALYNDEFIWKCWQAKIPCDGNQPFGINTPVEFMASLKGDCDTRALLLYVLLSHYGYDVALLVSELYAHAIIGINLPYNGAAYQSGAQRYVLWETTSFEQPGIVPTKISNMNHWKISLKSK